MDISLSEMEEKTLKKVVETITSDIKNMQKEYTVRLEQEKLQSEMDTLYTQRDTFYQAAV